MAQKRLTADERNEVSCVSTAGKDLTHHADTEYVHQVACAEVLALIASIDMRSLVSFSRILKPGGSVAIWSYSNDVDSLASSA